MNRVILTGRLTHDPELKTFDGENCLCTFTLAVDVYDDKTAFIICTSYNKKADLMSKSLRKGSFIAVEGKIDQRTYQTQNGDNKQITFVKVESFDYLEKKQEETKKEPNTPEEIYQELTKTNDDDLPF